MTKEEAHKIRRILYRMSFAFPFRYKTARNLIFECDDLLTELTEGEEKRTTVDGHCW